jgi:hypothetical protein
MFNVTLTPYVELVFLLCNHFPNRTSNRITKYLNERGIPTHTGKKWGVTGNTVYSVLKKYRERLKRLELLNREYEPVWGKMEVRWEKVV